MVALAHYWPGGVLAPLSGSFESVNVDELVTEASEALYCSDPKDQLCFISKLFEIHAAALYGVVVPSDFLELSLKSMKELTAVGRSNVIYGLAKVIGTKRPDSDESLLPLSRMPMGLLEHCVNFFSATQFQQVYMYKWHVCMCHLHYYILADSLSGGLPRMACVHVFLVWNKVGKAILWSHVES